MTYAGLPDAAAGTYAFRVRAVDLGDSPRSADNGTPLACSAGRWELRDPRA